jgi:uncharacterized protein (DUF3084 family)
LIGLSHVHDKEKNATMVWTMWQGWHDENQKNLRLERELKHLTTLLRRVADERDKLKEERDQLEEENKKLRNS